MRVCCNIHTCILSDGGWAGLGRVVYVLIDQVHLTVYPYLLTSIDLVRYQIGLSMSLVACDWTSRGCGAMSTRLHIADHLEAEVDL